MAADLSACQKFCLSAVVGLLAATLVVAMAAVFCYWGSVVDSRSPDEEGDAMTADVSRHDVLVQTPSAIAKLCTTDVPRETGFLVIAVAGGVLGACVAALLELTEALAGGNATTERIAAHLVRPIIGASVGLVFYAAIRGGLLTAADLNEDDILNPYAVISLAAIAGLASKRILDRLRRFAGREEATDGDGK